MPMTRRQSGFTLIEIMIAVAILAIIAAIAIPAYQGYILESRYGAALQDMRQMQLILDDLASDNDLGALDGDDTSALGIYMANDGSIVIDDSGTTPAGTTPWLDPWGNIYIYDRDDTATSPQEYTLTSYGPDGGAGGGDDASPN
jgi:prepilin-type N-terminal cleavage/methylation domain-containing protein